MKRNQIVAIAALLMSLSACGGGSESKIMPAVETLRLDVAKSDLAAAKVDESDIEVLGGGALGVVVDANWTVCDQEPGAGLALRKKVRLTVARDCGATDAISPTAATPTPSEVPATSAEPTEAPDSDTFVVPKLVGEVLQDAQDKLQSLGSYYLQQDDAKDLGRFAFIDSNWKVCSQKPTAGKRISTSDLVTLRSVKLNENCP